MLRGRESDLPPKYTNGTDLSARVGKLNPNWNEEYNASTLYTAFLKASALTGEEFLDSVNYFGNVSGLGFHADVKPLLSRSTTGEFNSPPKYLMRPKKRPSERVVR